MSAIDKLCRKCQRTLPASAFSACARNGDGLQSSCKECKRAYHVASYTPEKGAAAHARQKARPDYTAKKTAYMQKWRAANPERALDIQRRHGRKRLATKSVEENTKRRARWQANPEKYRARRRAYYAAHPARVAAWVAAYRARNPEKVTAWYQRWIAANAARKRAVNQAWFEANRHRWREYGARRKAAKLRATPTWADRRAIAAFYEECPAGHQVDHIVPLQGETVCGLHVLANLQYLPAKENASKRHFWWPDMAGDERRTS